MDVVISCLYSCVWAPANTTIVTYVYYSGHGEEVLRYWKQLDQSPNVMATQYYTVLRSIEEKQDGKSI